MLRHETEKLTKKLKAAALRDVSDEADKIHSSSTEHAANCLHSQLRDHVGLVHFKPNFGCRCGGERGRLLEVWDRAVEAAAENLSRLCRRQLMAWELEEVKLGRRLTRNQKRNGCRYVFAPRRLQAAMDAVRLSKLQLLADDVELERSVKLALQELVGEEH